MSKTTAISWVADPTTGAAGRTWNPVTGCDRISLGCSNCYALTLAARLKAMGAARYQNDGDPATSGPGFGITMHRDLIDAPRHWRKPSMVFVNSMSDLFHARVDLGFVRDVFATMAATPQHTYQVLTKRAARLPKVVDKLDWPANLWMGVSVENQAVINRIAPLRIVPTSVRFLSAEPLIGPLPDLDLDGIDWVIVGGESGANARPMDMGWVREIRDQCEESGTAFFFKQYGNVAAKAAGLAKKGADPAAWPVPWAQDFPVPDPSRVRDAGA